MIYNNLDYFAMDPESFLMFMEEYNKNQEQMISQIVIPDYINKRFNKAFKKALIKNEDEFSFSIEKYPFQRHFERNHLNLLSTAIKEYLSNKPFRVYFSKVFFTINCTFR